ncbi:MAG TPA: VOC family protein [Candidatus Dormibacteraeota bacterium]|nr:VOC family protein [Candidatus Dormibacteraeota bacterium]
MGVTGIGGFFFRAANPEKLAAWYAENLGVGRGEFGSWDQQAGQTVFSPFEAGTDYFPAEKQWMLNFRVEGLDELKAALESKGIEVITNPEWDSAEVGRFARIRDPEGNAIELWEPA